MVLALFQCDCSSWSLHLFSKILGEVPARTQHREPTTLWAACLPHPESQPCRFLMPSLRKEPVVPCSLCSVFPWAKTSSPAFLLPVHKFLLLRSRSCLGLIISAFCPKILSTNLSGQNRFVSVFYLQCQGVRGGQTELQTLGSSCNSISQGIWRTQLPQEAGPASALETRLDLILKPCHAGFQGSEPGRGLEERGPRLLKRSTATV